MENTNNEVIKGVNKRSARGKNLKKMKETVLEATDGVLSVVAYVILTELLFGLNLLVSGSYSGSVYRASRETDKFLDEIEADTVKRGYYSLKNKGYITYVKSKARGGKNARLTQKGLKFIEEILPQYKTERPWDGKLYFITYDIPEIRRKDRRFLRRVLKRFGCGLLQKSVWITPYDPQEMLEAVVEEYGIAGDIIVSDTGKEGGIGKTSFKELMTRVYNLEGINDRYAKFIEAGKMKSWKFREQTIFRFLSIVNDDPQLPYELLPEDWLGDEAYFLFTRVLHSLTNS